MLQILLHRKESLGPHSTISKILLLRKGSLGPHSIISKILPLRKRSLGLDSSTSKMLTLRKGSRAPQHYKCSHFGKGVLGPIVLSVKYSH